MQRHLVIFARRPQLGVGKRRLARDVGDVAAWRFARLSLSRLKRRLGSDPRWTLWLAISPDRPMDWARVIGQGGGDLGQRMGRVFRTLPRGPVVIIGSDTPAVSAGDIAAAFAALGRSDAVFGPAVDGGYWLIGMRRRPRLTVPFQGVRWSSPHALADTLRNLDGARVSFLRHLEDVDDGQALKRARWR
jgi:rSAM/selenodomain-associated transferase 1